MTLAPGAAEERDDFICTWIHLDSPAERSEYPQVGRESHLREFQDVYWRCVAVFFACSAHFNPGRRHVLFTNVAESAIPDVDGVSVRRLLAERNVEVVTLPMTWQTPPGYYPRWRNQFFVFDILGHLGRYRTEGDPAFLLLDSDCVVRRPLDDLFAGIREHGLMVLPIPFDEDHELSGITRREMREVFAELDGVDPGAIPTYYGGELFAASLPTVRRIDELFPPVWEAMMRRHREGKRKFNYEAPCLSYLYHRIGTFGLADRFVKRIWTSALHSNVAPSDLGLAVWHVPAEKRGGLALLFRQIAAGGFFERSEAELDASIGGCLGIPGRTRYLDWRHRLRHTGLYRWMKRAQAARAPGR